MPRSRAMTNTKKQLLNFAFAVISLSLPLTSSNASATPKFTDPVGKFTVQVAAYREQEQAKARTAELKGVGYNAFFFRVVIDHKDWYRVAIGLYSTQAEAETYRQHLLANSPLKEAILRELEE
jgi:cell division septation protein DedD